MLIAFITAFRKINSEETLIRHIVYGLIVRTLLIIIIIIIIILFSKSKLSQKLVHNIFWLEYIVPFLLFNYTLTGKQKHYFNFSILITFLFFISIKSINTNSAIPLNVSILYVGLSITILTGSFFYFTTLPKKFTTTNFLQEPSFIFVLGFFLSHCLSLLNNISYLILDLFSDFKHYPLKGSQSNLKIPLLTSYLITIQLSFNWIADIITYLFLIKGLRLGSKE
jgi:hypothetical protein